MLEDCLIESRSTARTRKPATLAISILVHGTLAAALVVIPLFQTPLLPQVAALMPMRPPVALGRSVELVPVSRARSTSPSPVTAESNALTVPPRFPSEIAIVNESPSDAPVGFVPSSGPGNGGGRSGLPFGVDIEDGHRAVPPPRPPAPPTPPPAPPAATTEPVVKAPIRVGSLEPSKLVYSVQPVYPKLASISRTQGSVVLEAVITRDGAVDPKRLKVISGHTLLVPAAVEAVQQWRYRPTVLSGEPVEILATITVNFILN